MANLDWKQPAGLQIITSWETDGDGRTTASNPIDQMTLVEAVQRYSKLHNWQAKKCRIIVAGGFHIDGHEIEALVNRDDYPG